MSESSRDLVLSLRSQGMSNKAIGQALGRGASYISKVATGAKPGNGLEGSLSELRDKGSVATPPPRRARADGTPARVRISVAKARETGQKSALPPRPPAPKKPTKKTATERAPRPRHGRFGAEATEFGGGARRVTVTAPKTDRGEGRDKARHTLRNAFTSAAKGQRHGQKQVSITAHTASGKKIVIGQKGGYDASKILQRIKEGDDVFAAIGKEANKANQKNKDFREKKKKKKDDADSATTGGGSGGGPGAEESGSDPDVIDFDDDPITDVEMTMWK